MPVQREYPPVLRTYRAEMWRDTTAAIEYRRGTGSYLFVAMTIYDAAIADGGRFTVSELVQDWSLDRNDAILLLVTVKEAWAKGHWTDPRSGKDRRGA